MLIIPPHFSRADKKRVQKNLGLMLSAYLDIVCIMSNAIPEQQSRKEFLDRAEKFRLVSFGSFAKLICLLLGIPSDRYSL